MQAIELLQKEIDALSAELENHRNNRNKVEYNEVLTRIDNLVYILRGLKNCK